MAAGAALVAAGVVVAEGAALVAAVAGEELVAVGVVAGAGHWQPAPAATASAPSVVTRSSIQSASPAMRRSAPSAAPI